MLRKRLIFLGFSVASGIVVAIAALSGQRSLASFLLVCLVVIASMLLVLLRRNPSDARGQFKGNHGKAYFWFGLTLIFGALLRLAVQLLRVMMQHSEFSAGTVIEFAFEMLLAYYLITPSRSKASKEQSEENIPPQDHNSEPKWK